MSILRNLDKEEVKKITPHRYPMLLVDEVVEVETLKSIHARFFVDPEWSILEGHFPGDPVMPGVLCVECMAQATSICLLLDEKYQGKTPLFASILSAKFMDKVTPGVTVDIICEVTKADMERDLITTECRLEVDGKAVCTSTLMVAPR